MNRPRIPLLALAALLLAFGVDSVPAHASTGEVHVFGTELEPVMTYENPGGCYKLPLSAHVLVNGTDSTVQVHGDPFCLTPGLTVAPGYGSHVAAGSGSFSVA
ncbi:hypothetical protein [Streptomyces sp. MMBL 11-3]|uniref:hypothetical protein n=1 Tax=Streptomyces sp. MMBL 11-3 TaxID=3382639 RepID=UPI0039B5E2DF